jgi:hypothetical protein
VCRDVIILWLLWQLGVAQWWARGLGRDLGARPVSSSRGLRILGPVWALVSPSGSIFWFRLRYVLNSNTSLPLYLFCNSRMYVITLYSGHVCVYYASMLQCWHHVWILVRTDHSCLRVGHHRYREPPVTAQNSRYDRFAPAINGWETIYPVIRNIPTTPGWRVWATNLKRTNPRNNSRHHFSTLRLARADGISTPVCPSHLSRWPGVETRGLSQTCPGAPHSG